MGIIPRIGGAQDNNDSRRDWVLCELKAISNGKRILDAGAGTQYYRQHCQHLDYVAQDFAAYVPNPNGKGLQNPNWEYGKLDIISDITEIPEPDASFDAILCSEVLEHLPYPIDALKEFSRLLKPGGILIMTAPFCSLTHQAPYFFSTGFSNFYYEKILTDVGFRDIETLPNGSFFKYMAQETHRINSVSKKYTGKALNLYQKIICGLFLRMLAKLDRKDRNSGELLCFGYLVKAIKKV